MRKPDGVCITVAPNGAHEGRLTHPALPVTPLQIATEARACRAAGATILHLHVRDVQEGHSLDVGLYREAIAAVREVSDLVVQPTTECAGKYAPDDMIAVFQQLRPEMLSVNLQELVAAGESDDCARACEFLAEMSLAGTVPQYIVYSVSQLEALKRWRADGWLPQARPYILLVLGRRGVDASPRELLTYLRVLPDEWDWGVCAFGRMELDGVLHAALLGGHCRVGFENNLYSPHGHQLADNAEQVARLGGILEALGKRVMTPSDVRTYFGLPKGVPND